MAGKRPIGEGSIYSYKGRWFVQGVIGGKRRKVGRATQAAARTAWEELKKESERGARTPSGYKNVAELLDRFYAFKEPSVAYRTRVGYRSAIDQHLKPRLGKLRITELKVQHVRDWQDEMTRQKGLAASTVRQARNILSQALDLAVADENL